MELCREDIRHIVVGPHESEFDLAIVRCSEETSIECSSKKCTVVVVIPVEDKNVHAEAGFVKASQDILKRELKDRYVSTLEVVLPRYEALAKKASGTRAGDIAEKDAARVRQLLRD